MSHRARLALAATVTGLFLAVISAAGALVHSGAPAPAPVAQPHQVTHAPAPSWSAEND